MFPSIAANDLEPFNLMEIADSERVSEDWVTDPQQLADWQNQLVRFCEDINMQLSQIRQDLGGQDLGGQTVRSLKVCALSNGNGDVCQDESRTISQA